MGITAVFHSARALLKARMKPVYPWTEIARGIPISPKILVIRSFFFRMK